MGSSRRAGGPWSTPNRTLTYVLADQPPSGTGPLAINRPRHWQVEGTLLTLTTQDETGKPLSVGRWRKTS